MFTTSPEVFALTPIRASDIEVAFNLIKGWYSTELLTTVCTVNKSFVSSGSSNFSVLKIPESIQIKIGTKMYIDILIFFVIFIYFMIF